MRISILTAVLLLFTVTGVDAQQRKLFKCPSADGVPVYTDKPCPHHEKANYELSAKERLAIDNIPITLRLQKVTVAQVLSLIAETAGKEYVYSPTIKGFVMSAEYEHVPIGRVLADIENSHSVEVLVDDRHIYASARHAIAFYGARTQHNSSENRAAASRARMNAANNESIAYNRMLDIMEARYAVINPRSPAYDDSVVRALERLVSTYENNGATPTAALRLAVITVFEEDPF